jgi:hypothetical protein
LVSFLRLAVSIDVLSSAGRHSPAFHPAGATAIACAAQYPVSAGKVFACFFSTRAKSEPINFNNSQRELARISTLRIGFHFSGIGGRYCQGRLLMVFSCLTGACVNG